jgi:hypothetical protein
MPVKINELIVQTRIATSDASNTGGADMRSRMLIHQEKKKEEKRMRYQFLACVKEMVKLQQER